MAKDVIARLKADTSEWDSKLSKAQRSMDKIASGSMKMLGKMAAAWLTVETAVKAFDKTIRSSQSLTDEWGRTMQATTRVIDSFFESVAQGDMSKFLSGLDTAVRKARELYDAMDAVGTFDIFASGQRATAMADIKEAKYKIRAGIGDAEHWKQVIRDREAELKELMMQEQTVVDQAVLKSFQSITNSDAGLAMFKDLAFSKESTPENRQARALEMYNKMLEEHSILADETKSVFAGDVYVSQLTKKRKWDSAENEELASIFKKFGEKDDETLKAMMGLWDRRENARGRLYDMQRENLETLNFKGGAGGSASFTAQTFDLTQIDNQFGMTSSMAALEQRQAEALEAIRNATTAEALRTAEESLAQIQKAIEAQPIALKLNIPEEEVSAILTEMEQLSDNIRNSVTPLDTSTLFMGQPQTKNPLKETDEQINKIAASLDKTSTAFGTMGSAMQSLDDPSAKVAGIVMEAIANVAASFAQALSGARDPWTWIAAAVGGTATMISTISAIKSVTAGTYADGGTITGGAYTGDAVPIMANAGELVLNASQQQNLASQLRPRDLSGNRQPFVTGEQIFLGLNNHLRRSGKGELVTSKQ